MIKKGEKKNLEDDAWEEDETRDLKKSQVDGLCEKHQISPTGNSFRWLTKERRINIALKIYSQSVLISVKFKHQVFQIHYNHSFLLANPPLNWRAVGILVIYNNKNNITQMNLGKGWKKFALLH